MKCNNKMCTYQKDNLCTLTEIEIDWRGNCKQWINTRIVQETLDESKAYTKLLIRNTDEYSYNSNSGEMIRNHMDNVIE